MASRLGPAPWSEEYKAISKRNANALGYEWDLSAGWHPKVKYGWNEKPKHVQMKEITLPGAVKRTVKVPVSDYTDYMNYRVDPNSHEYDEEDGTSSEISDYISYAFERTKSGKKPKVWHTKGVGHISSLDYSTRKQLLKVEFANNGAVVVYFRVPAAVYGELSYLAESGDVDNDGRHLLGIRFWDIIRIRGQLYGSKYRFKYITEGTGYGNTVGRPMLARETIDKLDKEGHIIGQKEVKTDQKLNERLKEYNKLNRQDNEWLFVSDKYDEEENAAGLQALDYEARKLSPSNKAEYDKLTPKEKQKYLFMHGLIELD